MLHLLLRLVLLQVQFRDPLFKLELLLVFLRLELFVSLLVRQSPLLELLLLEA